MRRFAAHAGFTIIEVMVVVAMMAVVTMMASPFLSNTLQKRDLRIFTADAVDALREAQSAVMSGRHNARYGVHFQGESFVFFQGATYNPADIENVVHTLSLNGSITDVVLSPGGTCTLPDGTGNCDVHFSDRRGVPVESGAIIFTDAGGEIRTVTINAAGMTDEN